MAGLSVYAARTRPAFSRISSGLAFRIMQKIFPPVPKPVIPDFTRFLAQNQVRDNNLHPSFFFFFFYKIPFVFLYLALTDALQKILERPEEVDELILYHLQPEGNSTTEDAEETPGRDDCYGDMDQDTQDSSTRSRMSVDYGDERADSAAGTLETSREAGRTDVENEIAMLIYKNGLVFDAKTDSP